MFDVDNANEPFRPYVIFSDRRSVALSDLSDEERGFLDQAMELLEPGLLMARQSDVIWNTKGPRHKRHALAAIQRLRNRFAG
ncbi:DUF7380 domain-containing protein [Pseudomonas sp. ITEM 17296]|uniref:DUF7380 domain-containing protein n=1 Tax=Pseudomonas sp. ITEM 17296 TaxID=2790281 RepID=UPI00406C6960